MNIVDAIINFFGEYTPLMGTFYVYDANFGGIVEIVQPISGLAGVNWPWIAGVAVVLVSLFCLFRMLGGIFKGVLK